MVNSKGQIGFQQVGVGGVLKQYRLTVPPNQREYSWTDREVTKLLQDFARAIASEESEYFLGTVVTIPRSPEALEVVDGQQRLATTAIFLAEVRNYLRDREALISESIDNGFLTDIDREKRQRIAKLQLNLEDNEFFRRMMSAKTPAERPDANSRSSHQLITSAFELAQEQIKKIVAGFDVKDHGDVLNRWIRFVEHSAQVILLKVPTDANAYKMFETLNDRGLRTSQADLIKNYLFGQSGDRLMEAQQKWALMRGTLESLEEEEVTVTFLRHALMAISGFLTAGDVYEEVQSRAKGPQTALEFLGALEGLAVGYAAIFNPEHDKWNPYPDSIRRAIQTMNLLNIRPMRPLMLAVASRFSPKEANDAFRMFISWGVRLFIAGSTRSESVAEPIAQAAHRVFSAQVKQPITTAAALKKELANIIPVDEQFKQAFELATVSKATLARYYLRSLEMAAKNEPTPWFIPNDDKETINLEHILPERRDNNWPKFDEETARIYVKRIGNLALLLAKNNSDLRSADFQSKKKLYKDSPYELTRQLSTVSEWDGKQISVRQKGLAELALRAWPL